MNHYTERNGVTAIPLGQGARVLGKQLMLGEGTRIIDPRGGHPRETVIFTPTRLVVRQTSKYNPRDEDRKQRSKP